MVELCAPVAPIESPNWTKCIGELPSLPSAFLAALKVLSEEDAPATSCIEAIERDQALTVRILRLANSAFYGAPGQISRIGDAVRMLGLRTVACALAAVSLRSAMGSLRCEGFCFDTHWRHALCSALAARELAKVTALDAGEAFLVGLTHDMGKLVLAMSSPELEAQALLLCRSEGLALHEAEKQTFGVAHPEVGAAVARQWNFPSRLTEAIENHHGPLTIGAGRSLGLTQLVQLANAMAHGIETPPTDKELLWSDPLWSTLGVSKQRLGDLRDRIGAELLIMSGAFVS